MKSGASFCTLKTRYLILQHTSVILFTLACLNLCFSLQIYTDFDEIRQEIEAETDRISGNNKVRYGCVSYGCFLSQTEVYRHLKYR